MSGQGGYAPTGYRALLGSPGLSFYPLADDLDEFYDFMTAWDASNFPMAASTAGNGDDQETNSCGIAMSHAYSVITNFEMDGQKMIQN